MKTKKVDVSDYHVIAVVPANMHKSVSISGVLVDISDKVLKVELDKFLEDMKPTEFPKGV